MASPWRQLTLMAMATPDYLLYNASTRQTAIWYLNNNIYVNGAYAPDPVRCLELDSTMSDPNPILKES